MSGWVILIIACTLAVVVDRVCATIVECKKVNSEKFLKNCAQDAIGEEEMTMDMYS